MLGRKGVVRDVEAGGSNPLTPTTKPLVTGLREQPDQGLLSFSRILGAILGAIRVSNLTAGREKGSCHAEEDERPLAR